MNERGKCVVANQFCSAAHNHDGAYTVATCYACGEHVCPAPACSLRTNQWPGTKGRIVRVCAGCVDASKDTALTKRLDADLYRAAEYPVIAKDILAGRFVPEWRLNP